MSSWLGGLTTEYPTIGMLTETVQPEIIIQYFMEYSQGQGGYCHKLC